MYTDPERETATKLIKNTEAMDLLRKVFVPERALIREELEKNIASLSDEQYGQLMKALVLAEAHVENSFNNLKRLAKNEALKKSPIAPK